MSKSVYNSYLDWELNFRKKTLKNKGKILNNSIPKDRENINSIGILESEFKKFMKEWKEKNLKEL
ncbi:MAG: hypothetical protein ACTSUN_05545 [Promethearchaeota archaeon]